MAEISILEICNDGGRHQWRGYSEEGGMTCAGCGTSEAELDHLMRQAARRKAKARGNS